MYESAESDIQGAYVGAPCKLICIRKAAIAAQLVVARPMGGNNAVRGRPVQGERNGIARTIAGRRGDCG